MFKKFIAQQIADKVSDIPENASIGDANAFAEEVMQSIELAHEQHLGKYLTTEMPNGELDGPIG